MTWILLHWITNFDCEFTLSNYQLISWQLWCWDYGGRWIYLAVARLVYSCNTGRHREVKQTWAGLVLDCPWNAIAPGISLALRALLVSKWVQIQVGRLEGHYVVAIVDCFKSNHSRNYPFFGDENPISQRSEKPGYSGNKSKQMGFRDVKLTVLVSSSKVHCLYWVDLHSRDLLLPPLAVFLQSTLWPCKAIHNSVFM